jgi:hypothetical protein
MRSATQTVDIAAPAAMVFAHVDDMKNIGGHMTDRSSMAMMGSKLTLEIVSPRVTGVGATYRYHGTMMGMLDFSESVTSYVPGREQAWRTIGEPRLLILGGYEMRVLVEPQSPSSSRLTMSITYDLPRAPGWRLVAMVVAGWYSRWCLHRMCKDTKQALERMGSSAASVGG